MSYFKKNPIFDRHIRYGVLLITKQKGKSVPIFRIYIMLKSGGGIHALNDRSFVKSSFETNTLCYLIDNLRHLFIFKKNICKSCPPEHF